MEFQLHRICQRLHLLEQRLQSLANFNESPSNAGSAVVPLLLQHLTTQHQQLDEILSSLRSLDLRLIGEAENIRTRNNNRKQNTDAQNQTDDTMVTDRNSIQVQTDLGLMLVSYESDMVADAFTQTFDSADSRLRVITKSETIQTACVMGVEAGMQTDCQVSRSNSCMQTQTDDTVFSLIQTPPSLLLQSQENCYDEEICVVSEDDDELLYIRKTAPSTLKTEKKSRKRNQKVRYAPTIRLSIFKNHKLMETENIVDWEIIMQSTIQKQCRK